jgi:UDP-glucose 4-epimerase
MKSKRVVAVTGVAGYWGRRVADELLKVPGLSVIGLDRDLPDPPIKDLDFIQAGPANPALVDLFAAEGVDTVCHLDFAESEEASESGFERNVMDSMKLFGACVESGVRKIVLKSSVMVYGAQPENSAFLREEHPMRAAKHYGYIRDLLELEAFCQSFSRQSPQVALTVLRFGHIVGTGADTPLMRFLREERAIVLLGFDPIMQVIHADDVIAALLKAVVDDAPGVFNVAAEPLMPLWRIMGLAGKTPMPILHPLAHLIVSTLGTRYAPLDLDYLRYRCVGDIERMQQTFNFVPLHAADQAVREIAPGQSALLPAAAPDPLMLEETQLRDTIARRTARHAPAKPKRKPARARISKARALETLTQGNGDGQLTPDEEINHV